MKRWITAHTAIVLAVFLAACTQTTSQGHVESAVPTAGAAQPHKIDISAYEGAKPALLLNDPAFRAVVDPIEEKVRTCIFKTIKEEMYLPLAKIEGGLLSETYGSHSENWLTSFIVVTSDSKVEIGTTCGTNAQAAGDPLAVFTSDPSGIPSHPRTATWLGKVSQPNDTVDIVTATGATRIAVGKLLAQAANVAKPPVTSAQKGTYSLVTGKELRTVGGMLKIVEPEDYGPRVAQLNGVSIEDISNDYMEISGLVRYVDKDVIIMMTGCSGSSCSYTTIGLIEVTSDSAKTIGFNEMTGTDSAMPKIDTRDDGSFDITFESLDGIETYRYQAGSLVKI